MTTYV
jgi:hypothetical protein